MTIAVTYDVYSTPWHINKVLAELTHYPMLGFDTETEGVYPKAERSDALKWLEKELSLEDRRLASVAARNSGLSHPSLVNVTHFIFGTSSSTSIVFITPTPQHEMLIWRWLVNYSGCLLIHNTLFDLKLMYHRVRQFPKDYKDTQLMAKSLINNADSWKAKVGLKDLMGSYYDPQWTLIDGYEPDNLRDPKFLRYAAIDGAATFHLYKLMEEEFAPDEADT